MDRISRCTPSLSKSYDPVVYRVVFASWSPIGVPFLESLVHDPRYEVVWVLTMPDMPHGRGMKVQENIIATTSKSLAIDVIYKPHSLRIDSKKYHHEAKDTQEWLQSLEIDILYVVAYGNLLPQYILDIPKIAPINIHGSLLPAYRGASPLQEVFLDGLEQTGITLMKMEAWLDSWPMIDKQIFKLWFSDTVADLIDKVKLYTPKWSLNSIDQYIHGELVEEIQDESLVTHCEKIQKEDGLIDMTHDTLDVIRKKYKWYYLRPKIYMQLTTKHWEEKTIVIENLQIDQSLFSQYKSQTLLIDKSRLNPAIELLQVKPQWGKIIDWSDFVRWYL